ncbi:MAG: DUF924 family protein [Alphaproteobacteria bacterium]
MTKDALEDVLDFWLGVPNGAGGYAYREVWFKSTPAFDDELRERFLAHHEAAAAGQFDSLATSPFHALAVLILLDQLPRNMFRGTPRMYATDDKALAAAERAVARGFDRLVHHVPRTFFYTPFEHSEDVVVQRRSLELVERMSDSPTFERTKFFIHRHWEIVDRFGRFPHRNAILGRETTPEEAEFLKEPHSSF